jgi:Zn-dependent protease
LTSNDLAFAVIWIALFFLVFAPVHECAHAFTAWRLGDGTAKLFGRVSLDPITHFDPVGGGLLLVSVAFGTLSGRGIGFGWAKPTPVNPYNLRGRYASTMVSVAGPASNLVLAAIFAIGFRFMFAGGNYPDNSSVGNLITMVCWEGIQINIVLFLFNLIPIPPLDGSHVLLDVLDPRTSRELGAFFDQYGIIMLVVVVLFVGRIIGPFMNPILSFLAGVPVV